MKLFQLLLGLAVGVALVAAPSAEAAKKKKGAGTTGVVEQVLEGAVVVKVTMGKKKKGAAPAEGASKKFVLGKDTKIEKVEGKKKNQTTSPATALDMKIGDQVIITADGDKAESIKIMAAKKKKKKKNT